MKWRRLTPQRPGWKVCYICRFPCLYYLPLLSLHDIAYLYWKPVKQQSTFLMNAVSVRISVRSSWYTIPVFTWKLLRKAPKTSSVAPSGELDWNKQFFQSLSSVKRGHATVSLQCYRLLLFVLHSGLLDLVLTYLTCYSSYVVCDYIMLYYACLLFLTFFRVFC